MRDVRSRIRGVCFRESKLIIAHKNSLRLENKEFEREIQHTEVPLRCNTNTVKPSARNNIKALLSIPCGTTLCLNAILTLAHRPPALACAVAGKGYPLSSTLGDGGKSGERELVKAAEDGELSGIGDSWEEDGWWGG